MKDIKLLLVLTFIVLFLWVTVSTSFIIYNQDQHVEYHQVTDSARLVELSRFIDIIEAQAKVIGRVKLLDKDSIKIGYGGYLYDPYSRQYKIREDDKETGK